MKLLKRTIIVFILMFNTSVPADEVLWKSGQNLYIKIVEKDESSDGVNMPNQHPAALNPNEIRNALSTLVVWDKSFFTGALKDKEEVENVFSLEQARLLGTHLAIGLQKAMPSEDIIFALTRRKKSFLFMKDTVYTGGRAFYVNGKLNIIIGDYDKLGDKFKERVHQSHGISEIKYYIAPGKREKHSGFKKAIVLTDGVTTFEDGGNNRTDWYVIDVKKASAVFLAEQSGADPQTSSVDEERLRREAAKSAQERRELRLEMARLRKEMKEQSGNYDEESIEARLQTLEKLKDKNIITAEEYKTRRAEILDDI